MDIAPHHVFCLRCEAACPPHARFCGTCGNKLSTQHRGITHPEYALPKLNSTVSALQPAQPVPAPLRPQPAIILTEQTAKRQPSAIPAPQTRKLPAVSAGLSPAYPAPSMQPSAIPAPQTRKLPVVGERTGASPVPTGEVQAPLLKQRYQLIKKVGVGGYGIVHKAFDTEFGGRPVAIKEINQAELGEKDRAGATKAFQQEAYMLAGLTHPNLPSIYDYFTEGGRSYLVMSYIEGETLEAYMMRAEGGKLPVEKVLMIGTQLASVLSYLHKRNPPIIFRDLKPSNVMRIHEGQIYLIDFGIARHFKVGKSKDTIALGSPGYAAPEQYGRAQSTPQTDVYSLGATLHHMLTGTDPSDSPFNHSPLDLPRHPQLSILINCMLELDPRKRPASMGNIKRELQRISAGRSYSSTPPAHNQHQYPYASPASSQAQSLGGRLWQNILTSVAPAEYTQKGRGIRHNSY